MSSIIDATSRSSSSSSSSASDRVEKVSNLELLRSSSNFRYFFSSYLVTQIGFSLNLIASLSLLATLANPESLEETETETAAAPKMLPIAGLLFIRLLPPLIISPLIGGPIADKSNKKQIIIFCDLISSVTVLLFPLAAYLESSSLVYFAAYMPSKSAIVPFILDHDPEKVKSAAALLAVLWSATNAIGSAAGGEITSALGFRACFYINVATFIISAGLMSYVDELTVSSKRKASFDRDNDDDDDNENVNLVANTDVKPLSVLPSSPPPSNVADVTLKKEDMTIVQYLTSKGSIPLLFPFCKALGALLWGSADILTFVFSKNSPQSLGLIYASIGVGCLIGTLTLDSIDLLIPPPKLKSDCQTSHDFVGCLVGVLLMCIGFFGMSFDSGGRGDVFDLCLVVFWTTIQSVGSAYVWVFSALLIQILSDPAFLGRVYAIENSSSTFAEGFSSFVAAIFIDYWGIDGYTISRIVGAGGFVFVALPMIHFWYCRYSGVSMASSSSSSSSSFGSDDGDDEVKKGIRIDIDESEDKNELEGMEMNFWRKSEGQKV